MLWKNLSKNLIPFLRILRRSWKKFKLFHKSLKPFLTNMILFWTNLSLFWTNLILFKPNLIQSWTNLILLTTNLLFTTNLSPYKTNLTKWIQTNLSTNLSKLKSPSYQTNKSEIEFSFPAYFLNLQNPNKSQKTMKSSSLWTIPTKNIPSPPPTRTFNTQ